MGSVTLSATVADAAGNVSSPAQVSFSVIAGTPDLAITTPADGSLVLVAQPEVDLVYTENADPSTLDLQVSAAGVAFSCSATATSAACTPVSALPEGPITLTATISGYDGSAARRPRSPSSSTSPAVAGVHRPG